ncbi:MAG: hypothetical protein AAFZ07_21705 [Actinomycetota bacterium]
MIVGRAPARTALVGNPSDGYGGAVLTLAIDNFGATVELAEAADRSEDLVDGPPGLVRIVEAARRVFRRRISDARPARLNVSTTVPREVGLAGSSAVVVATLDASARAAGVELSGELWPSLALHVETEELGIPGGLQDRVAQVWGGLMLCDVRPDRRRVVAGLTAGAYRRLPLDALPPLAIAWLPGGGESSTVSQAGLQEARDEPERRRTFAALGELAVDASHRLAADPSTLRAALDATMAARRRLVALHPQHAELVDRLASTGAGVNYSGSGGAAVTTLPDGDLGRLAAAVAPLGAEVAAVRAAAPRPGIS